MGLGFSPEWVSKPFLDPHASVSPVTQDPTVGQLRLALGAGLAPLNESNAGHSSCLVPVSMQCYGSPLGGPGPAPATGCFWISEELVVLGTLMAAHPRQQLVRPQTHAAKACPNPFLWAGYFKV